MKLSKIFIALGLATSLSAIHTGSMAAGNSLMGWGEAYGAGSLNASNGQANAAGNGSAAAGGVLTLAQPKAPLSTGYT